MLNGLPVNQLLGNTMPVGQKIAFTIIAIPIMLLAMNISRSYRPRTWQRFISFRGAEVLFRSDGIPRRGYRLFVVLWFAFCLALLWLFA